MSVWELFLIGVGLSMDAFAVSVCKGLSVQRVQVRHMLLCGAYFGTFQALMPTLGYLLGSRFAAAITRVGHWVAFALLAVIGLNMIRESFGEADEVDADFSVWTMLGLAVATSIDALAVGVAFAAVEVAILPAVALIGGTTFAISAAGVRMGAAFGARWHAAAERVGGAVLVLIGLKILLEGLGVL